MNKHLLKLWFVLLVGILLTACGGSNSSTTSSPSTNTANMTAVASAGATVTSVDPALAGAKLVIPAGAVESGQTVNVKMESAATLPGALPKNATQSGKVIVLTKDTTTDFSVPVSVTVPYDKTSADVPTLYYWDAVNQIYQAVAVSNIDPVAGTVTFSTVHFSQYAILQPNGVTYTSTALQLIDTGFDPAADSFFVSNFGSYTQPGGSSLGMGAFSIWYYSLMKSADTNTYNKVKGLYNKYREGDPNSPADDITAQTLITKLQNAVANNWSWELNNRGYFSATDNLSNDKYTGLMLAGAMSVTGKPQTLIMKSVDANGNLLNAQAVVVYKFTPSATDPKAGTFSLYDPGFRGEVVTIDWSPTKGFSNYSKAAAFSNPFNRFMFSAPSNLAENGKFKKLFDDAEKTFTGSSFATIATTSPAFDASGIYVYTVTDPANISIPVSGSVSGGGANYIVWSLNSGAPTPIPLAANGAFNFTVTGPLNVTNTLSIYATDNLSNKIGASGYKTLTIKTTGSSTKFLTNAGFESGDTTGWVVETHKWSDSTFDFTGSPVPSASDFNPNYGVIKTFKPNTFTPGKSAVVSSGTDSFVLALGTSLYMTQFGSKALRVNNDDNDYHISSATQTGTIPASTTSNLFIVKWAAILEDPQHSYYDQPFVEVVVTDVDTNTILYRQHFFSNDPRYTGGWISLSGGSWKMIDWQNAQIDISKSKGHQVKVQVSAGDCNQGGHGGYAYLDIDQ